MIKVEEKTTSRVGFEVLRPQGRAPRLDLRSEGRSTPSHYKMFQKTVADETGFVIFRVPFHPSGCGQHNLRSR
jgi:hypothetical protein